MRRSAGVGLAVAAVVAGALLVRTPQTVAPPPPVGRTTTTPDPSVEPSEPAEDRGDASYRLHPLDARTLAEVPSPVTVVRGWTVATTGDVVAAVALQPGRRGRVVVGRGGERLETAASVPEGGVTWLGAGGRVPRVAWWTERAVGWVDVASRRRGRAPVPSGLQLVDAAVLVDGRIAALALPAARTGAAPARLLVVDPAVGRVVADHVLADLVADVRPGGDGLVPGTAWQVDRLVAFDASRGTARSWRLSDGTLLASVDLAPATTNRFPMAVATSGAPLRPVDRASGELALRGERVYATGVRGRGPAGLLVLDTPSLALRGRIEAPVRSVRASPAGSQVLAELDPDAPGQRGLERGGALLLDAGELARGGWPPVQILPGRAVDVLGFAAHAQLAYVLERPADPAQGPVLHAVRPEDGGAVAQRRLAPGAQVVLTAAGPLVGLPQER